MKTLYIVDHALKLSTLHFNSASDSYEATLALDDLGFDVFTDRVSALTTIELCQDQRRKNNSKEDA